MSNGWISDLTSLIMIVPSMAKFRSVKLVRTTLMILCIRSTSWRRNMFIGFRAPIFNSLALTLNPQKLQNLDFSCWKKVVTKILFTRQPNLMWHIIRGQFPQHVLRHVVNNRLPSHSWCPCAFLGLDIRDCVENFSRCVRLIPGQHWTCKHKSYVSNTISHYNNTI